ncbi:MAG: alpha-glucuronidase [Bacteroidales bacterium]|nr:alpha-glucuronidase [Bacteroidales bacterium]
MKKTLTILALCITLFILRGTSVNAENGHSLWLRMIPVQQEGRIMVDKNTDITETIVIAVDELTRYWRQSEQIILKTAKLPVAKEGFYIQKEGKSIYIMSPTDRGILYGTYELLRRQSLGTLNFDRRNTFVNFPIAQYRILNHWDNLNGTIERGFAGHSIFWNISLIDSHSTTILKEYARANASIGINGTVINNVNASPQILNEENILRAAYVADILRPYGIQVYLSVNFASPKVIGGLPTADPLDEDVRKWWKDKVNQIYNAIPDFGGFLVKANSEGQPGPGDYHRTHADGANMLAEALQPHNGIVMWRAFVYAPDSPDRANQAYEEFMPLDGAFNDNVILQVKNGPIDFQPREPVSPLFFGIKKTNLMPEFQITQEYTGESIHTCFLASMWNEFFNDIKSERLSIAFKAIAGVANIGNSINWCGSDMAQANWYAFGRLAWNPTYSPEMLANEWLQLTYSRAPNFVEPMTKLLCETHEAVVNYMMPLGLHHIFAGNHHYGPEPWYAPKGVRIDWTPPYYHKADSVGLGFDRTATGSNNLAQYPEAIRAKYDKATEYILYFHHVKWADVWPLLCEKYDTGVRQAEGFAETWRTMKEFVDTERFENQLAKFDRQAKDAWWWRDACLLYFQEFSKLPFPQGSPAPRHKLEDLKKYHLRMDNYTAADITKLP